MSKLVLPGTPHRAQGLTAGRLFRAQRAVQQVVPGEDNWLATARIASGQQLIAAPYDPLNAQNLIAATTFSGVGLMFLVMVYVPRSATAARIGYGCDSLAGLVTSGYNGLVLYSYDPQDVSAALVDNSTNATGTYNGKAAFGSRALINGYTIGRGLWLIGFAVQGTGITGNFYGHAVPDFNPNFAPSANGDANGGIVTPRAFEIPLFGAGSPPATIDLLGGRSGYAATGAPSNDWPWVGLYSA